MPELYQLSNWIDAVKIKNQFSPSIQIDILQMKDNQGYILTVFESTQKGNNILYRFPVECGLANNWSLATPEAISMLNTLGFLCEWVDSYSVPVTAYDQLVHLRDLGWTKIIRSMRPAEVYLLDSNDVPHALSDVVPNYEYSDWKFLTVNIPESIENIINRSTTDEGEDTTEEIPTESE